MQRSGPRASRPWNRFATGRASSSAPSPRASHGASRCGMIMEVSIGAMISRPNFAFWGSRRVRRSCVPRKATASRNGSFGRSKSSSCGSARSKPSKSFGSPFTTGCVSITSSGWLSGMGSAHRSRCAETCWPRRRRREDVDGRNSETACEGGPQIQRTQLGEERRSSTTATHRSGRIRQQPCPRNRERYSGVDAELLGQFGQGLIPFDRSQRHLCFKGGSVIPSRVSHCLAPLCRHLPVALVKPGYHLSHCPIFRSPLSVNSTFSSAHHSFPIRFLLPRCYQDIGSGTR